MEPIVSLNPATGEELIRFESFDPAQVPEVVHRARVAQKWWGSLHFDERSSYLRRAKHYMFHHIDEIAAALAKNNGKPLVEAMAEIMPMIQTIDYASKKAKRVLRNKYTWLGPALPTKIAYIGYRPMGVIGIISPWNYPLSTPLAEIILALACGNAVVIKPSEVTGLVNEQMQKIVDSMQLPDDVFTMIHGRGDVGAALVKSGCDRIIVTGSVATGKKVMEAASHTLTPVTLELGGKDCMIVLEDADLDKATSAAVTGSFYNTGQTCCSVEKLLVHRSIHDKFVNMLVEKTKKLRQGESKSFDTDIGPVTYEAQKSVYASQLKDHLDNQYTTIYGDTDYDGKAPFMKPLIVEAAGNQKFWNDETFGPVVAVKSFSTDEEAIEINNNSTFGLTAMIWTANTGRARKMAPRLNTGTVVINDAPFTNYVPNVPWGGVGESGFGWVHGELGLKELCHAQVVTYDLLGQQKQFWWYPHNKAQYDFFKNYARLMFGVSFKMRWEALKEIIKCFKNLGPRL